MRQVVAIVGLSGVGKSTLIGRVANRIPLQHLQASDLIKAEQAYRNAIVSNSEELRLGAVLDNQRLLIEGFKRATRPGDGLIVFDGHAVIFGAQTVTEIPSAVFDAVGCRHIIVAQADPAILHERRLKDEHRVRPNVDIEILAWQQQHAKAVAARIAADLTIPLSNIAADDADEAIRILSAHSRIR